MTITRPSSSTRMGALAVLLLLAAQSRADSECPGKGSTSTSVNILGTVVPPYPQGFDSFEGTCIPGTENPVNACKHTIGILQTSRDDRRVGIFAGVYDRLEQERVRWKVTDYIAYPDVPDATPSPRWAASATALKTRRSSPYSNRAAIRARTSRGSGRLSGPES